MTTRLLKICRSHAAAALVAAVIALLASQVIVSAHAAKYGDGPHKHDGQVCVLSLATHGPEKAIANAGVALIIAIAVWRVGDVIAQTGRAAIAVRAAQPRGPPSF